MALPGVLAPLYLPHHDIGFRLGPLACCWGCVSGVRRLRILLYSQFAPPQVSCSRSKLIRWVSGLIYVASCPEFVVSVVRLLSFQLNTKLSEGKWVTFQRGLLTVLPSFLPAHVRQTCKRVGTQPWKRRFRCAALVRLVWNPVLATRK